MRIDISETAMRVPYPVFIPLGLSQGLRFEPSKGQIAGGVITRKGQRVVVDPLSYSTWLMMQLGLSEKELKTRFKEQLGAEGYDASVRTLTEKNLVHRLESYTELDFFRSIRVVPKATGVGSLDKDHPLRYVVRPNFGDKEVVMNPLDYQVWTMWDGKIGLMESWKEATRYFDVKLPEVIPRQVGILMLLMGQGMISIDYL